jgi:hypothetical protein
LFAPWARRQSKSLPLQTLKVALAAGVTDRLRQTDHEVEMIEAFETVPATSR